jgi:hypothetical protein
MALDRCHTFHSKVCSVPTWAKTSRTEQKHTNFHLSNILTIVMDLDWYMSVILLSVLLHYKSRVLYTVYLQYWYLFFALRYKTLADRKLKIKIIISLCHQGWVKSVKLGALVWNHAIEEKLMSCFSRSSFHLLQYYDYGYFQTILEHRLLKTCRMIDL